MWTVLILTICVEANNFSDSRCRCLCPPLKTIEEEAKVYFGKDADEATTCTSEKVVRPKVIEALDGKDEVLSSPLLSLRLWPNNFFLGF